MCLFSVASFNFRILDNYYNKNTVKKFAADIRRCRNLAIKNNYYSEITYSSKGYSFTCKEDESEFVEFPEETIVESSSLKFNSRGIPSLNTPRTIKIKMSNRDYVVTITPVTGMVNIK